MRRLARSLAPLLALVVSSCGGAPPAAPDPPRAESEVTPRAAPRCGVCLEAIVGKFIYITKELTYHERCFERATRCEACGLPADGERGPAFFYADHRATCAVCRRDAVFSQEGARETLEAAREALASVLAIDLGKIETPVTLLPRPELHAKAGPLANRWLKGLTEVEEEGAQDGKRGARRYRIFVLYGLPRAGLLGVLCHELFHVFQSEKNPKTLEADAAFREGAANYVQVCVLNARGESLRARLLERQGDSVYGEGLRRFEKLAADRGLRRAIELGAREQRFPDGY